MENLRGKKILVGITGGIAAYKINLLVRQLLQARAVVKVVMTPDAATFTSPQTLGVLSQNPVYTEFFGANGAWNQHVELGLWADALLIAPCTANTLAKMSHGLCDNFLMAVYLSAKCPVFIAPAMDLDMYAHPTTLENMARCASFGNLIIPAGVGELASGLHGAGRMAEPEEMAAVLNRYFHPKKENLAGKTLLITAGPTYEAIDPVRFIGNHSSGKMGFALAEEAASRGAKVILITGPTALKPQNPNIKMHRITSAKEMYHTVFQHFDEVDAAIASAAVADYAPKEVASEKIKKNDGNLTIELIKNPDILAEMGRRKEAQILVGFALETQNEEQNALDKLQRKNLDFIVLNSLKDEGAGFQQDTNRVSILSADEKLTFSLKSKTEVAADILDVLEEKFSQ